MLLRAALEWSRDLLTAGCGRIRGDLLNHPEAVLAALERSRDDEFVLSMQMRLERYLTDLDDARVALDWAAANDRLQIREASPGSGSTPACGPKGFAAGPLPA